MSPARSLLAGCRTERSMLWTRSVRAGRARCHRQSSLARVGLSGRDSSGDSEGSATRSMFRRGKFLRCQCSCRFRRWTSSAGILELGCGARCKGQPQWQQHKPPAKFVDDDESIPLKSGIAGNTRPPSSLMLGGKGRDPARKLSSAKSVSQLFQIRGSRDLMSFGKPSAHLAHRFLCGSPWGWTGWGAASL